LWRKGTPCGRLEKVNRKTSKRRRGSLIVRIISHYLKEGERLCGVCLVKRFAFYRLKRQTFPSVHDIANAKFKEELKDFEQRRPDLANRLKSLLKKYMGEEKLRLWEYNAELFDIKELERTKMEEGDPEGVINNLIRELRQIYDNEVFERTFQKLLCHYHFRRGQHGRLAWTK
jgi:hypothetical protein